jgi:hypothetical protein
VALFKPGQSGNPKGRPPVPQYDLIKHCRRLTPELIERVVGLTGHKDAKVALTAMTYLIDRGWGRPRQSLDVEGGPPVILASVLDDATKLFNDRMRRLEAHAGDGHGERTSSQLAGGSLARGTSSDGQSEHGANTVTETPRMNSSEPGRAVVPDTMAQRLRRELLGET